MNEVFFRRRRRHPTTEEDLSAFVDGQLGAAEQARVEAHVETCGECREALTGLRALKSSIQELPQARAPRSFALREADVRPQESPRPFGAFERAPALLGGLASLAVVVLCALVFVDLSGGSRDEGLASLAVQSANDSDYLAPEVAGDVDAMPGANGEEQDEKIARDTAGDTATVDVDDEQASDLPTASSEPGDGDRAVDYFPSGDEPPEAGGFDTSLLLDEAYWALAQKVALLAKYSAAWYSGYDLAATPECEPTANCLEPGYSGAFRLLPSATGSPIPTPTLTPAPMPSQEPESRGDSEVALRAAEAATAALALFAVGSLALVWHRRRSF